MDLRHRSNLRPALPVPTDQVRTRQAANGAMQTGRVRWFARRLRFDYLALCRRADLLPVLGNESLGGRRTFALAIGDRHIRRHCYVAERPVMDIGQFHRLIDCGTSAMPVPMPTRAAISVKSCAMALTDGSKPASRQACSVLR